MHGAIHFPFLWSYLVWKTLIPRIAKLRQLLLQLAYCHNNVFCHKWHLARGQWCWVIQAKPLGLMLAQSWCLFFLSQYVFLTGFEKTSFCCFCFFYIPLCAKGQSHLHLQRIHLGGEKRWARVNFYRRITFVLLAHTFLTLSLPSQLMLTSVLACWLNCLKCAMGKENVTNARVERRRNVLQFCHHHQHCFFLFLSSISQYFLSLCSVLNLFF